MAERIFVSSTCYDLIDLRSELEKELRELGLNPILSDRTTSEFIIQPDQNSIENCLINVRKSTAVVIILSQRYGGSLLKSGFDDVSATHLEYREAVKYNIPILFFVRDRFEADYSSYEKVKDVNVLKWIRPENIKIFDLFEEHKKLFNNNHNNWFYPFKDSVELKERLRIDLKKHSGQAILDSLAKTGQAPCIITKVHANWVVNSKKIFISLELQNVGNVVAIEPFVQYYEGDDYEKVDQIAEEENFIRLDTILPSGKTTCNFEFELSDDDIANNKLHLIFEIAYATITGHYLADISYCQIQFDGHFRKVENVLVTYNTKKYYHSSAINHLTENKVII